MEMTPTYKDITFMLTLILSTFAFCEDEFRSTSRRRTNQGSTTFHPLFARNTNPANGARPLGTNPNTMNSANGARPFGTSANTMNTRNSPDYDGPIVYPTDGQTKRETEKCSYGLCYNVAGYPEEKIKKILTRSDFMHDFFDDIPDGAIDLGNRFNSDEMALCDTMVHTIYPEKANNTLKEEKIIVNVDGHKQGIVFETCVNNAKCKFSNSFPSDYTSYCKQKYIHKRLMVLGIEDKVAFDTFEVPSCCVCIVKKNT